MSLRNGNAEIGSRIEAEIAEMLATNLKIPVYVIDREQIDRLYEAVRRLPEIDQKYSPDELYGEVSNFLSSPAFFVGSRDEAQIRERVERFVVTLEKEKTYEATVILPGLIDLPVGTKLGLLEIIEPNKDDGQLQEYLEVIEERRRLYLEGRSWGGVEFRSYRSVNVVEMLHKGLELPFAILSLVMDFDLDVRDCAGIIRSLDVSSVYFMEPQNESRGWSRYSQRMLGERLERLSHISIHSRPSRLAQKILQAIQLYGLSRLSHKPEIRFLLLISSLESLLLTENDRDYLGTKLAEKTAFLVEDKYPERCELFKLVKRLYGKRSALVHSGKSDISNSEVRTLEGVFREVTFRLLDLSKTYSRMEQKSNDPESEGIEDLINRLKFS